MKWLRKISVVMLLLLAAINSFAQFKPSVEMTKDEEDLYETCHQQFFDENYNDSYKGFSQLLSLYPREEVFNYYYGACLVKLNNNIKSGIDYLEFAAGKGINPANFYIGLGYHFMYDFDKALEFYNLYKINAKQKDIVNFEVEQYINMANSGIDLVRYAYELKVISSKKINRTNFHYSYNLNDFGGKIIVKTEQFMGKADKQILEIDLMYISEVHNVLFFSSYGDSKKNSLDIYMARREKGTWTEPRKLPDVVNTKYDEAYPFLSEDGITLYFSSKGHTSMGGYDVFRTIWNPNKNQWSEPENLDFPVNTPFDDIMYAIDRFNETAFFASTRETKTDQISIYRILSEIDPQRRKLETISDIYSSANLQVNPLATTELTQRQEIRAMAMRDTTSTQANNTILDSLSDIDVLIQESFAQLNEISQKSAGYREYAASTYKLSQQKLARIKELNKELAALKSKNDPESAKKREDLQNELNHLSAEATELYDISKYFYDAATRTDGLVSYYQNEMKILDNTPRNEKTLENSAKNTRAEINKIDTVFPLDKYIADIDRQKAGHQQKLDKLNASNKPNLDKLDELNDKISIKIELARDEQDFEVREKYVYDLKTYENEKIDVISVIKDNEVQIGFVEFDVKTADSRIESVNKFREEIENGLFYDPNLNLTKANNEIETLRTSLSQSNLKEMAQVQDYIMSDLTYYSPIVDYDGILYGSDLSDNNGKPLIYVDTKDYTEKYKNVISPETNRAGNLIALNDSLKEAVVLLESAFDMTDSDTEKQKIINDINRNQIQINDNKTIIRESLSIESTTETSILYANFDKSKSDPLAKSANDLIKETENLIIISKETGQEISDLKLLDKKGESVGILFLEVVKNDVDKKIEANLKQINEIYKSQNAVPSMPEIITELKKGLSDIQKQITNGNIILADLNKAKRLYSDAAQSRIPEKKNEIIIEANSIVELNLKSSLDFLNNALVAMYSDYLQYESILKKYNLGDQRTKTYTDKAADFKKLADDYQLQAEEIQSGKQKLALLCDAWKNIELANLYLNYVFDFLNDKSKYVPNTELNNRRETINLIAAINSAETQDVQQIEVEPLITDVKPEIIESLIADADKIKTKTDDLTKEYQKANPERKKEILSEVEILNKQLNERIEEINAEIAKAQKEIIIANYNKIEKENPGANLSSLEAEVAGHNQKLNNTIDSKDFYMLGEVIIAGEKIIKKQNDMLKDRTVLVLPEAKISELKSASGGFSDFVIRETAIIADNNTQNQVDTVQNQNIADNSNQNQQNNNTQDNLNQNPVDTVQNQNIADNSNQNQQNHNNQDNLNQNPVDTVQNQNIADNSNQNQQNNNTQDNLNQNPVDTVQNQNIADNSNQNQQNDNTQDNLNQNPVDTVQNQNIADNSNQNQQNNNTQDNLNQNPVDTVQNQNIADNSNQNQQNNNTQDNLNQNPVDTVQNQNIADNSNQNQQNNNTAIPEIKNLDEFVTYIDRNSANTELSVQYKNTASTSKELEDRQKELDELNEKLKEARNKKEIEKINSQIKSVANEQTQQLITQSENRLDVITDLDKSFVIANPSLENDTAYIRLLSRYKEQRNSVISYNNFYSADELYDLYHKANETETLLVEKMLGSSEPEMIAQVGKNLSPAGNQDIVANNSSDVNTTDYSDFNYNYDNTTAQNLEKYESQLSKLKISIEENENTAKDIETRMENAASMSDYKKLQKELEKNQQKYLKNLKQYASLAKEYHSIKYSTAENWYANNQVEESNPVRNVTDSIHEEAQYDFEQSLAAFEVIINYKSKIPDKQITEAWHRAVESSENGLKNINTANNLTLNNDQNDPLVMAYYKTQSSSSDQTNLANNTQTNQQTTSDTVSQANTTDVVSNNNSATNDSNNIASNQSETTNNFSKVENNIIDPNGKSLYSDTNPITDLSAGEELCYRIQIGAYNIVVNNDRFPGLSPIFSERVPNSKLIRYMAGLFYRYNSAQTSLPVVQKMGYPDAFIVAYYNGKRISVHEARQIEERLAREEQQDLIAAGNQNNTTTNNQQNTSNDNNQQNTNNDNSQQNTSDNTQNTVSDSNTTVVVNQNLPLNNDLKNSTDVFFCIQIGVFRERVGSERLYKLNPIMYDEYSPGVIRHAFGKYYDFNTAVAEQNKIRQLGIKDAFVIAYANGKKISLNEAKTLIAAQSTQPQDQILVNINVPERNETANTNNADVANNQNQPDRTQPANNTQPVTETKAKVEYFVQLGVFRADPGNMVKDRFRNIAGNNKLYKLSSNNLIIYRTGAFTNYTNAQKGLNAARSGGIPDAFIVAYVNGKRVDVATAMAAE